MDFLVDMEPGSSLFDLGGIHHELSHLFGAEVDVISSGSLKPRDVRILDDLREVGPSRRDRDRRHIQSYRDHLTSAHYERTMAPQPSPRLKGESDEQ